MTPTLPHTGVDSDDARSTTSKASVSDGMREEKQDLEQGLPTRNPTTGINFGPTEAEDDAGLRFKREKTLERQHSINSLSRPRADPASRLAIGYRTMSIQLSEGGLADGGGKKKEKRALKDIADMDWHTLPVDDVLSRLGVSPQNGLDAQQAQRRLGQYGPNQMSKPSNKYFMKILGYVFGGFGVLLFGASIICFIAWKPLGNPAPQVSNLALAIVLLFVVLLTSIFNMWQDFSTSRVMASIAGMLPSDVLVIRDGSRTSITASELTRGDIVVLSMGQKMAADMRVISITSELKFDRSALTGESDAINASVDKTDDNYLESRNVVMAGTSCVSGSGLGIVTQTGDTTVFGRLAKLSSAPKVGRTPLQKEVFYFVITIASLAATLATICVIIWAAFLRVKHPGFMSVSQLLVNVVSIVVAFLPEGVPICVTLSLTAIAAKLRKSRVLAKSLTTVETLGSVNVLCSDKTGTLTQNKMWVQSCGMLGLESTPSDASKHVTLGAPVGAALSQLAHVGAICNAATFDATTMALPLAQRKIHGDATDTACLRASEEIFGVDAANAGWETLPGGKLAFNSKTKFAAQLMCTSATSNAERIEQTLGSEATHFQPAENLLLLVKGAPDVLLKRCTEVLDASGESVKLTPERQTSLVAMQENWASQGMRVLLFARRIVKRSAISAQGGGNVAEQELLDMTVSLTVVGLVGIVDPPRPEIPHVVKTCRGAGLRFFMVTGDFESTALAIARQVGIVTAEKVLRFDDIQGLDLPPYDFLADNDAREQRALCLTGSDIMRLQPQDWNAVCAMDEICFARTTPEQKLRIVKEFQQRDGVLAMTGDGVNDAPALKAAEVGIAMGGGSEVAMEAADLILLGDFSSILDALLYGRLCFDNLRKSIAYLLPAGSMSELIPVLLSFFVGLPQVLSNLQMIFICCLTDVAPALALVQEKPEANLLARKPRSVKHDRLVDWRTLLHSYLFVGVPYSVISSALAFSYMQRNGVPFSDMFLKYGAGRVQTESPELYAEVLNQANSIYFWSLITMQWFNLFAVRTRRLSVFQQLPFGKAETRNLSLIPAIIISLAAGLVVSYPAPLQRVFLTRPIDGMSIGISIACGLGLLMVDEVRKLCVRTWPKSYIPGRIAW